MTSRNRGLFSAALLAIVCITVPAAFGQSSHIKRGSNGSSIEIGIALDNWYLSDAFGTLSYSIGGILDVGAAIQYGFTSVGNVAASDVRLAINYSVLALKQDDAVPISARISGSYGFSKVDSTFLQENDLELEGIGYDIGIALFRDFYIVPTFAFRLGIRADFHSYNYTTSLSNTPPAAASTLYPLFQRNEEFSFGGETGLTVELTPRLALAVVAEMVFNTELTPILRPKIRIITTQ